MGAVKCMGKNPSRSWIFHSRFWSLSRKRRRLPATHTNNARESNSAYQDINRSRPIRSAINGRREMHGEEPVPFMDISFSVLVTVAEAAKITVDTQLARQGFDKRDRKNAKRPLNDLNPYKLKGKFGSKRRHVAAG